MSSFGAAGFALAAYTFWVLADTCLKVVGASRLPAYEVLAVIGLVEIGILVGQGLYRGRVRALWPSRPAPQVVRSGLDLANGLCVVVALRHVPLALFYILIFFAPLVTSILAIFFLREPLEWRRGLAILTGFLGVAVAVHRSGHTNPGDWTGYLACMICVVSFSANTVWSRVLTQTEVPESLAFVSSLTMIIFGASAMAVHGAEPLSAKFTAMLALTGISSVAGSLCFFTALRYSFAAHVSQYHYSQLLTGALLAYAIWRERPTAAMLVGATLIIASGAYTAALSYGPSGSSRAAV